MRTSATTFLAFGMVATVFLAGCSSEGTVAAGDEATPPAVQVQTAAPGTVSVTAHLSNFVAVLSGASAGTDSRGRGVATFHVSADRASVSFRLNVANIENVTMAHIHIAETPGGNGPPAVWLYPDGPPPQEIAGRLGGTLAAGVFTASDLVGPLAGLTVEDLVSAIEANRAYVNVHTTQNPPGEIRGQIR